MFVFSKEIEYLQQNRRPRTLRYTETSLSSFSQRQLLIYIEHLGIIYCYPDFLRASLVKNLPAMQETLVRFLGQEDLLEKE